MLDRVTLALCAMAGAVLTAVVLLNVVLRYGFGAGSIKFQDLAGYGFAVFLILSLPLALARGAHVRVEVVSERLGPRYLRAADALAWVLVILPLFGLIVWAGWRDIVFAWDIGEGAVTPGGLGGLYLVRTALPIAAALMILQGLACLLTPRGSRQNKRQIRE
ncbi:TRAP transporter small permease subunit [Maritimibacter sp. HL-12]|uniref:TRAP transporter small permease subunit n=1 Tax=Maritimibacter sp. HL-12 TaxID=1162418 RepID=UPI000A0F09A4|nr:TRAP transporter small permease subunit [Maritimibacter sp. HL-12]SMH38352.1 TRAP-type mannitol/chloroaromatic compound transport system, small permease component [Maritimibacter sp. HL-12]